MTKFDEFWETYHNGHTNGRVDFGWFMEALASTDFDERNFKFRVYVNGFTIGDKHYVEEGHRVFTKRDDALGFVFDECTVFNANLVDVWYSKKFQAMSIYLTKENI